MCRLSLKPEYSIGDGVAVVMIVKKPAVELGLLQRCLDRIEFHNLCDFIPCSWTKWRALEMRQSGAIPGTATARSYAMYNDHAGEVQNSEKQVDETARSGRKCPICRAGCTEEDAI